MSGNMIPTTSKPDQVAKGEFEDFMEVKFKGLYKENPECFNQLLRQLRKEGVHDADDLKYLDDRTIEKLELPAVQKNKLRSVVEEFKGDSGTALANVKNMVGLVLNTSSNGSSNTKPKVVIKDQAHVKMTAADDGPVNQQRNGKNLAVAGIGDVDVDVQGHGKFTGTAGMTRQTEN